MRLVIPSIPSSSSPLSRRAWRVAAALLAWLLLTSDAAAKKTNTYYSDADIAAIRSRAALPEYQQAVRSLRAKADRIAGKSDAQLWSMIPEPDLPRALNVRFGVGCPVHGQEVFKAGGHYPWIMSEQRPFKVQCPVGKEIYPTNDFASYWTSGRKEKLDITQKYVDGGDGWVDPDGNRYWFVGHYVFWHHWRHVILDGSTACADMYLITGDAVYAHKVAIVLARLTQVYPQMDYRAQAYHSGKWPAGIDGRILDYIWENFTVSNFARAYDIIYHTLDGNDQLQRLIRSHGITNLKHDIEQKLLQFAVRDVMAKRIWGNKIELGTLSTLALVLDNDDPAQGVTTEQMVEWLLRGDGELEFTFYNGFDRDGMGGESAPNYSAIWNERIVAAAENLTRLGVGVVKDPKWLRIARAPSELRLLDNLSPRLGDCGGDIKGAPRLLDPSLFRFGVTHFADPYCADLLLNVGEVRGVPESIVGHHPSPGVGPPGTRMPEDVLLSRHTIDESKLTALAGGNRFPDAPFSRNLGGGLAILELDDGAETRSATMYYGSSEASHGHRDRLTMSYHMRGRDVLTELGYPSHWGPIADHWVRNTPSHYCVMIDNNAHPTKQMGHLTMFVDLKGLKLAEAQAKDVWGGAAKDYRRMLALLDTEEKSSLLIDAFFTEGGSAHDYSFHGLPYGEFSYGGQLIRKQEKGTLAGEEVEFAQDPGGGRASRGHQFFMRPRWHEPHDVTRLMWRDDDGLNMDGWFPRFAFDEVVVADTQPPVKPGYPQSMPYILLRGKGEANHQSLYMGIIAVDHGRSPVTSVERIQSDSPKAGAALVTLNSGRMWRIYVNGSGHGVRYGDGSASNIPFIALLTSEASRPLKAHVAGSGRYEGTLASFERPAARALSIQSIDYPAGRATVDGAVLPGQVLISRNDDHHASFTVASVESAGASFTTGLVTGRFLARWDPQNKQVVAGERTGGVYNQFVARNFVGMVMISEDWQHTATITGHDAATNSFTIDRGGAAFADVDNDGRSYVYIADIGPGSTLTATSAKTIVDFPKEP